MSTLTIISPSITQTFLPLIAWDNINPDSCVRVEADVKGNTGAPLFFAIKIGSIHGMRIGIIHWVS